VPDDARGARPVRDSKTKGPEESLRAFSCSGRIRAAMKLQEFVGLEGFEAERLALVVHELDLERLVFSVHADDRAHQALFQADFGPVDQQGDDVQFFNHHKPRAMKTEVKRVRDPSAGTIQPLVIIADKAPN
jgi:hypothetical protein